MMLRNPVEADLDMFGRTGTPAKRGPHMPKNVDSSLRRCEFVTFEQLTWCSTTFTNLG